MRNFKKKSMRMTLLILVLLTMILMPMSASKVMAAHTTKEPGATTAMELTTIRSCRGIILIPM